MPKPMPSSRISPSRKRLAYSLESPRAHVLVSMVAPTTLPRELISRQVILPQFLELGFQDCVSRMVQLQSDKQHSQLYFPLV